MNVKYNRRCVCACAQWGQGMRDCSCSIGCVGGFVLVGRYQSCDSWFVFLGTSAWG